MFALQLRYGVPSSAYDTGFPHPYAPPLALGYANPLLGADYFFRISHTIEITSNATRNVTAEINSPYTVELIFT